MTVQLVGYEVLEKLHEGISTIIYRGTLLTNGQPVIIKILKPEQATPDNLAHFRREFTILMGLNSPQVISAYTLEPYQGSLAMTLEDIGGYALDRSLMHGSIDVAQCLLIATELAKAIGEIHQQRVIHKDINPSHIIWNSNTKQLRLIDFGLADNLSQQHILIQHPAALPGTLTYISPEQTGRVNRAVDYRTDFYSLGITLYPDVYREITV